MENKRTSLKVQNETALLVNVTLPGAPLSAAESLAELESLAEAAGATVLGTVCQQRTRINPAHYVGHGKAQQIAERVAQYHANIVIFDGDLSPAQIRELEKIIDCKVIDRSELILDIFASRARTHEARLQVDLAQLQYTYPRLTRMWSHLDTVVGAAGGGGAGAVGGIGTRGTGEKQLEIDRRIVQKRIVALRRQIKQIDQRKQRQVRSRHKHFTVSLVGYTNAGKSTLMNLLTGSNAHVADQLFATLDTKTRRWNLANNHAVLLSDTVGFIRNLPHHLVASFRATLEEAIHADLLLHVVDASHPQAQLQMNAAKKVLNEIGCQQKDTFIIFNKIDHVNASQRAVMQTLYPDAITISARHGTGVEKLIDAVTERLATREVHLRVCCSQADGRVPSFLHAHGTIISQDYHDSHVIMEAYLSRQQLPHLQRLQPQSCDIISPTAS